jgi:hypothetical protein
MTGLEAFSRTRHAFHGNGLRLSYLDAGGDGRVLVAHIIHMDNPQGFANAVTAFLHELDRER